MPESEQLNVLQVKEKLGGLRFYVNSSSELDNLDIKEAERICWVTCELCGNPGKVYSDGWSRILCNPCGIDWAEERRNEARD